MLNNSAANARTGTSNNGVSNGEASFKNVVVPNDSFTVKYLFTHPRTHHIIARINLKGIFFPALASFNVIVLSLQ